MSLLDELVELDVKANQLLGGRRETISARLGRKVFNGTVSDKEAALCQLLDVIEPDHCRKAFARSLDHPRPRARRRGDEEQLIEDTYAVLGVR